MLNSFANYDCVKNKIMKRKQPVIVRTFPFYNFNPLSDKYGQYCKYQLIKFKPWVNDSASAWNNEEECDNTFISYWQEFLQTPTGKSVPDWERELQNAESYFCNNKQSKQSDNTIDEVHPNFMREEWIYISDLRINEKSAAGNYDIDENVLSRFRVFYSKEEITEMVFWLEKVKSQSESSYLVERQSIFEPNSFFSEKYYYI